MTRTREREELMAPFGILQTASLTHKDSKLVVSLRQERPRLAASAAPQSAAFDDLLAHLGSSLPEGFGLIQHCGYPLRTPDPQPDGEGAAEYHARTDALVTALRAAGIAGAEQVEGMPAGWLNIIEEAGLGLIALKADEPSGEIAISQIKEKFGELRFYIRATGSEAFETDASQIASWAELCSEGRCAVTGKPGTQTNKGWILTLSPEMQVLHATSGLKDRMYPNRPAVNPDEEAAVHALRDFGA